MSGHDYYERRKAYRIYVSIPLTCEIIDSRDKSFRTKSGLARDISSDGIYFEIDEAFILGSEMSVKFQLPKSNNVIHATVRVVWIEAKEKHGIFAIGAEFIRLLDKDKAEINQMVERLNINKLLKLAIEKQASDLHLLADRPPVLRVLGELESLNLPSLSSEDIPNLLYPLMTKQQIERFEQEKELDFGFQFNLENRFRVNVHQQRGYLEATLRLINTKISSFEDLNLPDVVKDLASLKDGLILIAGPTGSGKTTTIAAMVEWINQKRKAVIITLERPIEYVHPHIQSIIKQREVGVDTSSFSIALKSSLRQDPNVIVVGELDDIETIRTAVIAAEAGYLVIASFHAPNTVQALDRLVSMFPLDNRKQILSQLSHCLKGVITQLLIPRKDKQGRALATEIVVTNEAIKKIIRNDELIQMPTVLQTSGGHKMQSMFDSIKRYVEKGIIEVELANFYSEEFSRYTR